MQVEGSAETVTLRVHNEGAPIPPSLLPVVFDPFRRQNDPARRAEGLGLGLFICREMVRAHGGEISVTSNEGTGTTFAVTVPRKSR